MAAKDQVESWTEEAVCSICLDFFTDPVTLECGHNFCRSCITQSWDKEGRNSCPECREEFADRTLRVNRALVRLAEKARALSLNLKEKESKLHCEKHQEELKLFCETDKKLICVICRDAREHKSHSFIPIEEAVEIYKEAAGQKRRFSDEVHSLSVTDGALPIEKIDHHFVLNTLWKETCAIQQVSITLDVETAHPELEVSEDRKRVRWTLTRRSLPDTGKRFTNWWCVLGSEGFTSGRHYWEVEVVGSRGWRLGVAAESVERKRPVTLTPETGVWSIWRLGDVFEVLTSPPSPLPARPIPGRVGVYLSYDSGTVSFYDANTRSHLHTFTGNKFTEKLYPFFANWTTNQWLRICSGSAPGV